MGSLRLSRVVVVVAAVVVCLSILLLSPTGVDGAKCDVPYGICWWIWPFYPDTDAKCKENCLKMKDEKYEYYDGQCRIPMSAIPMFPECYCCRKERNAEIDKSI